jgi:hypothetical protein
MVLYFSVSSMLFMLIRFDRISYATIAPLYPTGSLREALDILVSTRPQHSTRNRILTQLS